MFETLKSYFSISGGYDKTKFLTGFRAYAAIGVMLIHAGGAGLRGLGGDLGDKIVDFGKYGVIVFFVLSAFTIINSIDHTKNFTYFKYLIRRLFRILPLYFIVLYFVIFILGNAGLNEEKVKMFLASISFYNLFNIYFRNAILNVEWTIPIEVFFYLIIPFIFYFISRGLRYQKLINLILIGALISMFSIGFAILPYFNSDNYQILLQYSVERYAFTYVCGIALYFILKRFDTFKTTSLSLVLLLVTFVGYILLFSDNGFANVIFVTLWTVFLIIVCFGGTTLGKVLFENRIIQFLGTISYSMYLTHFVILNYLPQYSNKTFLFIVLLAVTIVISTITYYLVEAPFIIIGKNLTSR